MDYEEFWINLKSKEEKENKSKKEGKMIVSLFFY